MNNLNEQLINKGSYDTIPILQFLILLRHKYNLPSGEYLRCVIFVVCLLTSPNDSNEYKLYAMVKIIQVETCQRGKNFASSLTRNFSPLKFRNPIFLGDKKKGQREIHLVPNFCACLSIMILSHVRIF